ncbi:MAG: 16S rRNA (cytosine(1402)-N(4))-methyltransferase RsmH [Bacteroidota bacterium]
MSEASYHIPVLLHETVDGLAVHEGGTYVDVTFGGGGHTREILSRLNEGRVVAFDRDVDAKANLLDDTKLIFIGQDFQFIESALLLKRITQVDGILADLGISSHQIDTPERGFSYRFDAELDMRMDVRQERTAADILNEAEEEELLRIFWNYGELKNARKVVRNIISRRIGAKISTTSQLENILQDCIPPRHRIKFLSQVYQALRIEVNQELKALETLLEVSLKLLRPGGRLSIISYHSLEDRMVKRFMRSGNFQGKEEKDLYGNSLSPWKLIARKAIQPNEEEIARNPRARSARLRIAEKKHT